jgi:uncharacterized protein
MGAGVLISLDKISSIYILNCFEQGFQGCLVKIRVDEIKDKVLDLSAVEEAVVYPSLAALQTAGECTFLEPLRVQLTVAREYDHIRAQGRVTTRVRLGCSRCLAEYVADIDAPFTVFYLPVAAGMSQDEEVELTAEDLVSVTYEGDEIDFAGEISEQVLAEIPYKPLCREECRGLCPVCGVDLNVSDCGCKDESFNIKFGALKKLKLDT